MRRNDPLGLKKRPLGLCHVYRNRLGPTIVPRVLAGEGASAGG